jgi:hypothetical protein
MARCTAPVYGHRTASGAAACPACGGRYGKSYGGYSGYDSYSPSSYSPNQRGIGVAAGQAAAQSRAGREPVRPCGTRLKKCGHSHRSATASRDLAKQPDLRDVFLCHAWDDRQGPPRSFTICLSRVVSRSGSARRTLASACRCSAPSTRAWRTHE